jgi:hypothetical protein
MSVSDTQDQEYLKKVHAVRVFFGTNGQVPVDEMRQLSKTEIEELYEGITHSTERV